jgi:hypothetical protein
MELYEAYAQASLSNDELKAAIFKLLGSASKTNGYGKAGRAKYESTIKYSVDFTRRSGDP